MLARNFLIILVCLLLSACANFYTYEGSGTKTSEVQYGKVEVTKTIKSSDNIHSRDQSSSSEVNDKKTLQQGYEMKERTSDKLVKLKELKDKGILTQEEYQKQRKALVEQLNTELTGQAVVLNNDSKALGTEVREESNDQVADVDVEIPHTRIENPNAIAVVIGNRKYKNNDISEVKYAHNDARSIKKYLVRVFGYKEPNIIFKLDATKAEFEQIFGMKGNFEGELYDLIKSSKSDVFIYYSGHGAPDPNTLKGYFVPSDCDSTKLSLSGYSLDTFYDNISQLQARNVTVVIDACFSGGTNSGKTLISGSSLFGIKVENPSIAKGNTICLTSSEGNQISSWYDEKHHGLFTYFFLKGVRDAAKKDKDNVMTFQQLYEYLSDKTEGVPYWARRLHQGRKQNPTIQGTLINKNVLPY